MVYQQNFNRISDLEKNEYEACIFENCDFSNQLLNGFSFMECEFINCNFSNANIVQTAFQTVEFNQCKLMGLRFDLCNPFSLELEFHDSLLDFSSFSKCNLKNSKFSNTSLVGVDFSESNLTSVVLNNCNLMNAVFQQTNLEKADFTSASNFVIRPEHNKIKKAKFSADGLKGLLIPYDIVVK